MRLFRLCFQLPAAQTPGLSTSKLPFSRLSLALPSFYSNVQWFSLGTRKRLAQRQSTRLQNVHYECRWRQSVIKLFRSRFQLPVAHTGTTTLHHILLHQSQSYVLSHERQFGQSVMDISPLHVGISFRSALKGTLRGTLSGTLADESWESPLIKDKKYN